MLDTGLKFYALPSQPTSVTLRFWNTVNPLYNDTQYNDKIVITLIWHEKITWEMTINQKLCKNTVFDTSKNRFLDIC